MSSRCQTPWRTKEGQDVPCGKCPACHTRRISGWSFRLNEEDKVSTSAHFITLTYAPAHVQRSPLGNRLTLNKSHVQCFFKKLRRRSYWGNGIKYFIVGEYGSDYSRPHYHALVFNAHIENYQSCWEYGQIHYGTVTAQSVGYCLKYMCKIRKIPQYQGDDRLPEFGHFSKKLGISYLTPEMIAWHKADIIHRCYIPLPGGIKIAMPRYIKEALYTKAEKRAIELHMGCLQKQKIKDTYCSPLAYKRNLAWRNLRVYEQGVGAAVERERSAYIRSKETKILKTQNLLKWQKQSQYLSQ